MYVYIYTVAKFLKAPIVQNGTKRLKFRKVI